MQISKCVSWLAPLPLLFASLAAQADASVHYTVTPLGTVDGGYSTPYDINEQGEVIGSSYTGAGQPDYAFLYSNGQLTSLPSFNGGSAYAMYINSAGQVVGKSAADGATTGRAFLYDGAMHDLGTLGGKNSSANSINDAGLIVGMADLANGRSHAFLYAGGTMRDLGTLAGTASTATGINNAGQISGASSVTNGFMHAFIYANGTMTDLGTLAGDDHFSSAASINNLGQLVGSSGFDASNATHAFLYSNGAMIDIGAQFAGSSDAFGINDLGQVVGKYNRLGGTRGFIYADGVATDLNLLIDPASGWVIYEGSDINNQGQIAAYGFKPGYGTQALRLDPVTSAVPEPGVAGMLLSGIGLLSIRSRRSAQSRRK